MFNEDWMKMGKMFPFSDFSRNTIELCRKTCEQNLNLLSDNFARVSDQLKRLSNVHKPEEFFNLQKDILTENITAGITTMQKIFKTSMDNVEEVSKNMNQRSEQNNKGTNRNETK